MGRGIKKRFLAGFLAMLMMFSNGLQVWASNVARPLVQMSETETNPETLMETVAELEEGSETEITEGEKDSGEDVTDAETVIDNGVSEGGSSVPEEGYNKSEDGTDTSENTEEDNEDVEESLPEELLPGESENTEDAKFTEDWEDSEVTDNVEMDSEIVDETDVVEEDSEEETELLKEDMFAVKEMTVFTGNGNGVDISDLPHEFTDKAGNKVSTLNSKDNSVKLIIFDMHRANSDASIADRFRYVDKKVLDSENIQFSWILGADSDYSSSPFESVVMDYLEPEYPEMAARFDICTNEGNSSSGEEGLIKQAYDAYKAAVGLSADIDNSILFLVNDENKIVEYHIAEYSLEASDLWADVIKGIQNNLPCNLPTPTNLSTTEATHPFGNVYIYWDYPTGYDVKGFRVYRSDDDGTTYNDSYESYYWVDETDENGNAIRYGASVDVPLDQTSGNNGIATYKVVPVDSFGAEGNYATIQNKGGGVGTDLPESEYNGLRFLDANGNPIDSLTLHVGESKKIGLAFTKEDGSIANMLIDSVLKDYHTTPSQFDKNYDFEINWQVVSVNGQPTELKMNWVDYATSDVDWLLTKEFVENKEAYFIARSMPADGTRYFIEARVTGPCLGEVFWLRLPVIIEAAEAGVTYAQPEELEIITSQEAANQEMRKLMTSRDYEGWFVTDGISDFDRDIVMDIYAERNGMNPDEGDYLYYTMGDRDSFITHITYFEKGYNDYKNESYTLYRSTVPFITTAEEEQQVDNKIQALVHTPGGALYEAAHGENVSTEEKVRSIYNWITKNVSGTVPGDRRTPIYHTAYHTLIKGSGTCGAFAVLFTRLSREMGIPSKVIMGTDSAAHAYNIVQVGNKWYFIDTSSGRWLADGKSFTRAQEQSQYLDNRFIRNYLSKVPGTGYIVESKGTVVVKDSIGSEEQTFTDMGLAVAYVVEQAAATTDDVTFTMSVRDGDMAFPLDGMDFGAYGHRVSLDLGGYTLIVADGMDPAMLAAKNVQNGYISVGDLACLRLYANDNHGEATYKDLDIIYKSTTSGADNSPMLSIMTNGDGKVVLTDTVKIEKLYDIYLEGNAEVNCDLWASWVALGAYSLPDITVNGSITADQMLLLYGGCAKVDTLTSKDTTQIYNPQNTKLIIGKELNLNGYTGFPVTSEDYSVPVEVVLERQFASVEDNSPMEAATVNWTGEIFNYYYDYTVGEAKISPLFHFTTRDYVNGVLQENTAFASGDTIGKVTAKGLNDINANTFNYNVIVTPANYKDYFTVELKDADKNFVDIENNIVSVTSLSMVVTETSTGKSASFSSLKKAIDGLGSVANKKAGEYVFTFTENVSLPTNLVLPDYVQNAVFTVADVVEEDVTIDFKGYSLTSKGVLSIEEDIRLISSAINSGKLVSSKSTDATAYSIKLAEDVSKVNLSATSGTLLLEGTESETKKISGDVSAKEVQVNDTWEVEGTIGNSGLRNKGTLICDTFTQGTSHKTYLEPESLLVVNNKATLYNVTCEGSAMETQPSIYRAKNATVSFNGTYTAPEDGLRFAVLADNDAAVDGLYDTFVDFAAREALFTTAVKAFPVESVQLVQNSPTPKYTSLMQVGDKVLIVGEWIILKAQGVDGKEEIIKKFTNWKEASTYINNLSNASMTYVVEITDHLDLEEALTMPTKAVGIIFRGVSENDELIELNYTGDLKLTTNTTFENIDLGAEKLNTTTKQYEPYLSTANLAGKNLTLLNSNAEFMSVTGTNTSVLRVKGAEKLVTVSKAVKTLDALEVTDANVEIGSALKLTEAAISGIKNMTLENAIMFVSSGTVAMTGTLYMDNSILDTNSKIEVVDIISNNDSNRIFYGGNASNNILTVKGNVTAGPNVVEDNSLPFRKAALEVTVKSLVENNGYVQDITLLNAQKAPAAWFIVEGIYTEEGIRTGATYLTHKKGTVIKCGKAPDSVAELYVYDEVNGNYALCDSYITLQEAFDDIERIGNNSQSYKIVLMKDSILTGDYKFPTKAAAVVITSKEEGKYTLGFKSKADIKCNTTFENVLVKASEKSGTLAINGNAVNIVNSELSENIAITGNGITKGSKLTITGNENIKVASVKDVDKLTMDTITLYVNGTTTVGNVLFEKGSTLCSVGTVKTTNVECSGKGTIITVPIITATEVKPALEITGDVRVATVDAAEGKLQIRLAKTSKFDEFYNGADFDSSVIEKNKVVLAKAPKASTKDIEFVQRTAEEPGYLYKKTGTIVYKKNAPAVKLSYNNDNYDGDTDTTKVFETKCETFADAVAEIDNLKTKRDYTICFLPATGSVSAELKMPKSNNVNTLTLTSRKADSGIIYDVFYLKTISFTTDVLLKDISFVQMVQEKDAGGKVIVGQYVPVTEGNQYPAAVAVKTSGTELAISGKVSFNTPIALDGGNKAVLNVAKDAQVRAFATSKPGVETNIEGTITKFKEVNINNAFTLENPKTSANTYGTCTMDVTTLKVGAAGNVVVGSYGEKDTFKAKDVILDGGEVTVYGNAQLTNVTLAGNSPLMEVSGQTFNITGVLTSTAKDGQFITTVGKDGKSVLNISGSAVLGDAKENRIIVAVVNEEGDYIPLAGETTNADGEKEYFSSPLLKANKINANVFKVYGACTPGRNTAEYSITNPVDGYFLKKNKEYIEVHPSNEILAALCKTDEIPADAEKEIPVINYYATLDEAIAEIKSLNQASQEYTIMLLQDVGNENTFVKMTVPEKAAKVTFTKPFNLQSGIKLYVEAALTQKTNLAFENITFVNKKNWDTKNFDLFLKNADITVKDKATAVKLTLVDGSKFTVEKAATITDIVNQNTAGGTNNEIICTTAAGLTIKGYVTDTDSNGQKVENVESFPKLILDAAGQATLLEESYAPIKQKEEIIGDQYNLSKTKKLATLEKENMKRFVFQNGGNEVNAVWAAKGIYQVEEGYEYAVDVVTLDVVDKENKTYKEVATTQCLDMSEAANYINTVSKKTNGYYVKLEEQTDDTKVTDTKAVSEFVMPAKDKAEIVIFKPKSNTADKATVSFIGDVKANGNVTFEKIDFNNSKVFSLASIKGTYTLELNDVQTNNLKSITDVTNLRLVNSNITTQSTAKVENLMIEKNGAWNCYGVTTIGNVALALDVTGGGTYLGTYHSKDSKGNSTGLPQLTVTGKVTGGKLPVKVHNLVTEDKITNYVEIADYSDAKLVLAKAEAADRFVGSGYAKFANSAFGYKDEKVIPYKDKSGYVYNGNISEMQVVLSQQLEDNKWTHSYVSTYAEAIDIINNGGSKTDVYKITIQDNEPDVTVNGALPLPKKDKPQKLIIVGNSEIDDFSTLQFKGALQPKCDLVLEDVILQEVDSNGKKVDGITVKPDAYNVTFGEYVEVVVSDKFETDATLVFKTIDGNKGGVTFEGNSVHVTGDFKVKELAVKGDTDIFTEGKVTVTDIAYKNAGSEYGISVALTGKKEIAITNVLSENDENTLDIISYYKNKAFADSETQLTISGEVNDEVAVNVQPMIYDVATKTYHELTEQEALQLQLMAEATPKKFQKVINAPKMMVSDKVKVWYSIGDDWSAGGVVDDDTDDLRAIKHEGGIYFTDEESGIEVIGYQIIEKDADGKPVQIPEEILMYQAQFFTWDQAVKEIDKLNQPKWKFEIYVCNDQGSKEPLKSVTMPTKAKEVVIIGVDETFENGDVNPVGILTTSNKITMKCPTEFNNISLCAVKKSTYYYSIPLTLDSGQFNMILNGVNSQCEYGDMGWFASDIILNGAAKSTIEVDIKDGSYYDMISKITNAGRVILHAGVEDEDVSSCYYVVKDGIKGVKQLELLAGAMVNTENSEVSVTDLTIGEASKEVDDRGYQKQDKLYSSLNAKNITVSGTTYMASCGLTAGTTTVGDGKITLNNVVFRDNYNLIEGKLDKSGKTSINIKGTLSFDTTYPVSQYATAVTVGLYLNNSTSTYVMLTEGMSLLTAPKAVTSMLNPNYSVVDNRGTEDTSDDIVRYPNMGSYVAGWGLYRSGNDIKYGNLTQNEVRVHIGSGDVNSIGSVPSMEFATYEEAIKAIDSMAIYKQDGSKKYEEYTLELLDDVMIGNDKGDGKFAALTLPSKASQFTILGAGHSIRFSGNVSLKCNTTLQNVQMLAMKAAKGTATPTTMNITVGNFKFTNDHAILGYYEETTFVTGVNNVNGSAKGYLVMEQDSYLEANSISGMNVQFVGNGENLLYKQADNENSGVNTGVIHTKGNLTAKQLIFSRYAGGHLEVGGNLVLDAINTYGKVYAEFTICDTKPMQIKGMTQTIDDVKVTDSIFFLKEKGEVTEELILNVKSTTKQEVASGTKVMTGKYLDSKEWKVRTVLGEETSDVKTLYLNGANLHLGSKK